MALSFMRIDGKVVLITGASQGIGAACAVRFRDRGAQLALTARSLSRLYDVSTSGELVAAGDITDAGFRAELVERTLERFGRIDVLVNNAGAGLYAPTWKVEESQARRLFELNFFAPLGLIGLVAPHMRRRQSGMIVNVSSIAGKVTLPWFTLYSASKYAVCSLTDGLRMELKRDGIHAMMVCPGYVLTDFQKNVHAGSPPEAISRHPRAGRFPSRTDPSRRRSGGMNLLLKRTPGLYLVGFMGAGKTTIGHQLASRLGWRFVDLDDDIEHASGQKISTIFEQHGEAHFRELEYRALKLRVRAIASGSATVLALGGGAFAQPRTAALLEDHGASIWLDCPFETIQERVGRTSHRPLARDPERFRQLYEQRLGIYQRADYRVPIESDNSSDTVDRILHLPLFRP
ncbi:MAG: SDR family NAD(P)-dependent oxidoreductase [Acidobacteria bacterium]|nr:SDR family NAD(P)-dependent oxidoreductase [Acidobacteriota bacterium]